MEAENKNIQVDPSLRKYKIMLGILAIIFASSVFLNITFAWFYNNGNMLLSVNVGALDIDSFYVGAGSTTIESSELLSGEIIERTFQIDNLTTSEDCRIRIKGVFEMDYTETGTYEQSGDVQMYTDLTDTNWIKGNNGGFIGEGYDNYQEYYYYYDNILTVNRSSVTSISVDLKFQVYPTVSGGEEYGIGNEDAGKNFRITVYVESLQDSNDPYQTVWAGDYPVGWDA